MLQTPLLTQKCVPCNIGTPPLKPEGIEKFSAELKQKWDVIDKKQIKHDFSFKNFTEAVAFIDKVAQLAEHEGHHPDLYLHDFRNVRVDLWTHKINGLSENDFILAAKIEELL